MDGASSSAQNCLERRKVKRQRVLRLTLLAPAFYYENEYFVYHMNVLRVKLFKLLTLFRL